MIGIRFIYQSYPDLAYRVLVFTKGDEPGQKIEDVDDLGLYKPLGYDDKVLNKEVKL